MVGEGQSFLTTRFAPIFPSFPAWMWSSLGHVECVYKPQGGQWGRPNSLLAHSLGPQLGDCVQPACLLLHLLSTHLAVGRPGDRSALPTRLSVRPHALLRLFLLLRPRCGHW